MPVTVHDQNDKVLEFLNNHKVGVLATVDPSNEPHATAIYFTVDDNLDIFFMSKTKTKKADNLEQNNHAVLVVYEAATQTTVQATGVVSVISDTTEANHVFGRIVSASLDESDTPVPPISRLQEGDYVVYKLAPAELRMATYKQPKFGDYNDLFTTVVPETH